MPFSIKNEPSNVKSPNSYSFPFPCLFPFKYVPSNDTLQSKVSNSLAFPFFLPFLNSPSNINIFVFNVYSLHIPFFSMKIKNYLDIQLKAKEYIDNYGKMDKKVLLIFNFIINIKLYNIYI